MRFIFPFPFPRIGAILYYWIYERNLEFLLLEAPGCDWHPEEVPPGSLHIEMFHPVSWPMTDAACPRTLRADCMIEKVHKTFLWHSTFRLNEMTI